MNPRNLRAPRCDGRPRHSACRGARAALHRVGLLILLALVLPTLGRAFTGQGSPSSPSEVPAAAVHAAEPEIAPVSGSTLLRDPRVQPALPPLVLPDAAPRGRGSPALPAADPPGQAGSAGALRVPGLPGLGGASGTQSGDPPQQALWAWDFYEERYYQLFTREIHGSGSLRILVEEGQAVPGPLLVRLAIAFEDQIYPRLREAYGVDPAPGVDDDPSITILLLDIHDARYHGVTAPSFVAGYFDPINQVRQSGLLGGKRSNEREMIYVDVGGPTDLAGDDILQTSAHEFSHLILWNHDSDEDDWVSEGVAELGVFLAGLGHPEAHVRPFLKSPQSSLTYWTGAARDYGKVYLFMLYLRDQFAVEDPGWLRRLVAHPANGMDGLRAVLPPGTGPAQVFLDHVMALHLNDPSLGGGRFSFKSIDLGGSFPLAQPNFHAPTARGDVDFILGPWTARVDRWTIEQQPVQVTVGASVPGSACVGAAWTAAGLPPRPMADTTCLSSAPSATWTFEPAGQGPTPPAFTVIANVAERPTGGLVSAAEAMPLGLVQRLFLPLGLRR